MQTRHNNTPTRSEDAQPIQAELFASVPRPHATTFSATHRPTQDDEASYLCAWLRSRLEDGLWLIRAESALTAATSDRAQITRLAAKARALGLPVWPARHGKAA